MVNKFSIEEVRNFWDQVAPSYDQINKKFGSTHYQRFIEAIKYLQLKDNQKTVLAKEKDNKKNVLLMEKVQVKVNILLAKGEKTKQRKIRQVEKKKKVEREEKKKRKSPV